MIASLKDLFAQLADPSGQHSTAKSTNALQVATAVLLVEMMRMDSQITESERTAVAQTLRAQFGLDEEHLAQLLAVAERESSEANGYFKFTKLINNSCDLAQKVQIIENMWRIAMVDGHLDAHELHLMRKIGDLLHVGHADFIAAKQRARQAVGLMPE